MTVQADAGVTYRDDIQDAEEAVDTVSWEHFLHHAFFAILKKKKRHACQSAPLVKLNR